MAKQPKRPKASPAKTGKKTTKKAAKKTAKKAPKRPTKKVAPERLPERLPELPQTLPADGASTAETKPERPTADASRDFAQTVAAIAANTRCSDVVILDVKGLSPVTDFLVLATGQSGRQMRAVVQDVADYGKSHGYSPLSTSGTEGETWICADFVDVILHIFSPDSRGYYDLEGLWGDAKRVDFDPAKSVE